MTPRSLARERQELAVLSFFSSASGSDRILQYPRYQYRLNVPCPGRAQGLSTNLCLVCLRGTADIGEFCRSQLSDTKAFHAYIMMGDITRALSLEHSSYHDNYEGTSNSLAFLY